MRRSQICLVALCLLMTGECVGPKGLHRSLLSVNSNVSVTEGPEAVSHWFEMKADPGDGNHLIVCGTEWSALQNSFYGIVYVSHDAGRNWREALRDDSTSWVTEHSCAFGPNHIAFFVSEASRVVDGVAHHALGTTRIFRSDDSGETWNKTAETGWADFSVSGIGPAAGAANQHRLYVFYNGESEYNASRQSGSTLDFFSVSDDGTEVSARQAVSGMASRNYQGVYPSSSTVLSDGTLVVLYNANTGTGAGDDERVLDIGVVRIASTGISSATVVASPRYKNDGPSACPVSFSNTIAYDRKSDRLFVAYNDLHSGHCDLMLKYSDDHGGTWSNPCALQGSYRFGPIMYFPILAADGNGGIGVLWRGKPQYSPDCWNFSVFGMGGKLYDTVSLAACKNLDTLATQSSAYLMTHIRQVDSHDPWVIDLRTTRDYLSRIGISAVDGVFHPIWPSFINGVSEIRTAAVNLRERNDCSESFRPEPQPLSEVTDKVTVLYGGRQYLDQTTQSVVVALKLRNDGQTPLKEPFYLALETVHSDFGELHAVEPHEAYLPPNYVDVSGSVDGGILFPKHTSRAFALSFRFTKERPAFAGKDSVIRISARVFCRGER